MWMRCGLRARGRSAVWHALAWAVFGAAYVGAVVFVASVLAAPPGEVLLVLAAGSRLSAYIGGTVGEIGFLRGIWLEVPGHLIILGHRSDRLLIDFFDYVAPLQFGTFRRRHDYTTDPRRKVQLFG